MPLDRTQGLGSPIIDDPVPTRDKIQDYLGEAPPLCIAEINKLRDTAFRLRRALDHCRIELECREGNPAIGKESCALNRARELLMMSEWLERC